MTATPVGTRQIRTLPMGTKKTTISISMHRLRCHDCGKYLMENIPFISSASNRISKALERSILDLRKEMSIKAVANHFGLNWHTVKNTEKKHLRKKYGKISLKGVTAIGIDEVHMGEKIGGKGYLTIIRDLYSGATLFVGRGKSGDTLNEFAVKLKRSKVQIKFVAVDLAPSFTSWIKKHTPKATIVYDHFHVIKLMNERLCNIRRRIMRELEDEEKVDLKGKRWHFNRNEENLSKQAKEELENCCHLYQEPGIAHSLKEALRRIYKIRDVVFVENALVYWCEKAEACQIKELVSMAKTLRKHAAGIVAFWKTGITSAAMEGFNNKIGWLTRQAYGYRDEEYLILKIFDLPNLKVVKEL